jgi:hypothetical protein
MKSRLFRRDARQLHARRDNLVRRLDAVQASVVAAASTLAERDWRREHPTAQISPGALAQHIVAEFGWLSDVLQRVAAGGPTPPVDAAAWSAPAPGHLSLAVRNILDRLGRPGPDTAPLIDVMEAVVMHLEGHARSLAGLTLQDAQS